MVTQRPCGEHLYEEQQAHDHRDEIGSPDPAVVGTRLAPVVGNPKQQKGIGEGEGRDSKTHEHIEVEYVRPDVAERNQRLEAEAAEHEYDDQQFRRCEQQAPSPVEPSRVYHLDGVKQVEYDAGQAAYEQEGRQHGMVNLKVRMGNVGGKPEYAKYGNQQIEYGEKEARTVARLLPLAPHHDAARQADDQTGTDEGYGYDGMHLYTKLFSRKDTKMSPND